MDDQDIAQEVRTIASKTGIRPEIVAEFIEAVRRRCQKMAEGGDYDSKVTLMDAVKIAHRMKLDQRTGERLYSKLREVGLHEVKSWASPPSDRLGDFGDDKKVREKNKKRKRRFSGEKAVVGEDKSEVAIRKMVVEALRCLGLSQRKAKVYYRRLGKEGTLEFLETHKDDFPEEAKRKWDLAVQALTADAFNESFKGLSPEALRLFRNL